MVRLAWRGQRAEPGKKLIIIVLCATGSLCADPTYSGLHLSLRASTIGYRLALFERLDCVTKSPVCGYEKK